MAAAHSAACRPPVEEGAEVTCGSYIAPRGRGGANRGAALPETASPPPSPSEESQLGEFGSGIVTSGPVAFTVVRFPFWARRFRGGHCA